MTANDRLYDKLSAELNAYEDGLRAKPIDEILEASYELTWKREIVMCFDVSFYSDEECAVLLAEDNALDSLYREWLDNDADYLDSLRDCIDGVMARDSERGEAIETEAVPDYVSREPGTPPAAAPLSVGDWVVVAPNEEYQCLVGKITSIDKLGTPEHTTENLTDDVHVNLSLVEYSEKMMDEVLSSLNALGSNAEAFDGIALDDVIFAPEMLIRVTARELEQYQEKLKSENVGTELLSDTLAAMRGGNPAQELIERVEQNYADYQQLLTGFGAAELVDMATRIAAMQEAYSYMTVWHGFDDDEALFYLNFANPLEVVADAWHERNVDLDEMSFTMDFLSQRKEQLLTEYPLIGDVDAPPDMPRRFMNVNIYDFLGKIAEQTIIHYPKDWQYDRESLWEAAMLSGAEQNRFVWHVCAYGTHLRSERDVFVRSSGAYEYMTDYHQNDPDMFGYIIEITGTRGGEVYGNVFDVGNYAEYAAHIRDVSLPLTTVTLTYSDQWGVNAGKTITVPRREYDDDRHRLMSESGNVTEVKFNPASEAELTKILSRERSRRMAHPIGSPQVHLDRLSARLAEIRKSQEAVSEVAEHSADKPAPPRKRSIGEKIAAGKQKSEEYMARKAQNQPTKSTTKERE